MLLDGDAIAKEKLNKEEYTIEDLNSLDTVDQNAYLMKIVSAGVNVQDYASRLEGGVDYYGSQVNIMYNLDFDGRAVTGDDAYDLNDVPYGNAFTIGSVEDEMHGTHVAGIALATRNNGTGMNGVAKKCEIIDCKNCA